MEVITRDRFGLYASGAQRGAPQARQVADRFHLLLNLREAVEKELGRQRRRLALPPVEQDPSATKTVPVPDSHSRANPEVRPDQGFAQVGYGFYAWRQRGSYDPGESRGNPAAGRCKDFKVLKFLGATPIDHATWLPLMQPLVAITYPLTGVWSEDWNVSLCGRVSTVKIEFTADGMGGAYWHMGPN